jgi:hypothetical protein
MITVSAHWARKLPGPVDFSSIQAQASVQIEAGSIADVPQRAREAFALVQQAVEEQLRQGNPAPPSGSHHSTVASPATSLIVNTAAPSPSRPTSYPSGNGRRSSSPSSAAQHRLLRMLLDRTPGAIDRILAEHRVASIEALSSRAASAVIDQLKAPAP